jgi:hypothetical protein
VTPPVETFSGEFAQAVRSAPILRSVPIHGETPDHAMGAQGRGARLLQADFEACTGCDVSKDNSRTVLLERDSPRRVQFVY